MLINFCTRRYQGLLLTGTHIQLFNIYSSLIMGCRWLVITSKFTEINQVYIKSEIKCSCYFISTQICCWIWMIQNNPGPGRLDWMNREIRGWNTPAWNTKNKKGTKINFIKRDFPLKGRSPNPINLRNSIKYITCKILLKVLSAWNKVFLLKTL